MLQLHNPRTTHERVITEDTGSIIGRRKVSSRKKILNSVVRVDTTFEQSLEGGEGVSLMDMRGWGISGYI